MLRVVYSGAHLAGIVCRAAWWLIRWPLAAFAAYIVVLIVMATLMSFFELGGYL